MMLRTKRGLRGETRSSRVYSRLTRRQPFLRPAPRLLIAMNSEPERNPQPTEEHVVDRDGSGPFDLLGMRGRSEASQIFPVTVLKRTLTLTADAIVLTLAAPFFAVWWLYRAAKRIGLPK